MQKVDEESGDKDLAKRRPGAGVVAVHDERVETPHSATNEGTWAVRAPGAGSRRTLSRLERGYARAQCYSNHAVPLRFV